MKYSYSITQIKEAEERAIKSGVSSTELMQRAGRALASEVLRIMKEKKISDVLFVCGGGNNGGDGFAAARFLELQGVDVAVLCLAGKFSHDCAEEAKKYTGVLFGRIPRRRYALIVDCILGTGLRSAPSGDAAALIEFINGSGAYVISCDLPSGLSENGVALSPCVRADRTFTVGGMKNALLLADGADVAGECGLLDIGLSPRGGAEVWESGDVKALFPPRKSHSNKGNYGSVAILATCNILGAPLLAAGAALRSGAGYTDIYMTSASVPCEDAEKLASLRAADELHRALCAAKYPACRFSFYDGEPIFANAAAFGMGAGVGEGTRNILGELLSGYRGTLVLDADALNTLALSNSVGLLREKQCSVIVTPHIKEFSRLTGRTADEILAGPIGLAEAFAREYGVTVVLKNNRTVITDGERTAINLAGSPALAKGGSGDALAGLLAGTCARGVPPFEAACAACFLIGRAGELAEQEFGQYCATASDVIEFLPKALMSL